MKNKLYYQFSGSCFLLLFFFLGYLVKFYPNWLVSFDDSLTALARLSYPSMNLFFLWITKFADPISVVILTLTFLFLLIKNKKYTESIWLITNLLAISVVLNPLCKIFFSRERPNLEHLVVEHSKSFPSGHAATSMILYGTLIFILPGLIQHKSLRIRLQFILGTVILMIGISRVYLGVHHPSDILAGFSLSLAWLFFTYPFFSTQRFVWRFKNKQR